MSWYTDWFLADEADAEAVASLADDESHSFDDWPHLSMPNIGELELMLLWGLLNGNPKGMEDVSGESLFQELDDEGGVFVTRVKPAFIAALAALNEHPVELEPRSTSEAGNSASPPPVV